MTDKQEEVLSRIQYLVSIWANTTAINHPSHSQDIEVEILSLADDFPDDYSEDEVKRIADQMKGLLKLIRKLKTNK